MLENLLHAAEHLAGFAIVMIALCALWGITAAIGQFFIRREARARAAVAPAAPAPARTAAAANPASTGGIPDEELAVIATAVSIMLDQRHQIVSVRSTPSRWGVQGRSDIHASHRLR